MVESVVVVVVEEAVVMVVLREVVVVEVVVVVKVVVVVEVVVVKVVVVEVVVVSESVVELCRLDIIAAMLHILRPRHQGANLATLLNVSLLVPTKKLESLFMCSFVGVDTAMVTKEEMSKRVTSILSEDGGRSLDTFSYNSKRKRRPVYFVIVKTYETFV